MSKTRKVLKGLKITIKPGFNYIYGTLLKVGDNEYRLLKGLSKKPKRDVLSSSKVSKHTLAPKVLVKGRGYRKNRFSKQANVSKFYQRYLENQDKKLKFA